MDACVFPVRYKIKTGEVLVIFYNAKQLAWYSQSLFLSSVYWLLKIPAEIVNELPVLVTVPNVVWLLVTVLVVAVVFVTTTFASDCLLCQILPCPHCVWKIHEVGLTQFSRIFFWQSGNMRLSSNSKNRENPLLTNNKDVFLLKHVCETINNKQTMFAFFPGKKKKEYRERKSDDEVRLAWH